MHCYSCDILLSEAVYDRKTSRYYCTPCLVPTTEEMLRLAGKDYVPYEPEYIKLEEPEEVENEE